MKISKLFHWLYAILMFMPFGLLIFNAFASMWSGATVDFSTWLSYIREPLLYLDDGNISFTIKNVYEYLLDDVFGLYSSEIVVNIVHPCLVYWTCISIIWLIFDVIMYVPLLIHRWIDKAKLE